MSHEPECSDALDDLGYQALRPEPAKCYGCKIARTAYKRGRDEAADEIVKLHGKNDVNCYEDFQCYAYQQAEKAARGGEQA